MLASTPRLETDKPSLQKGSDSLQKRPHRLTLVATDKTRVTFSLPRVINVKFPLQPHEKYKVTQYEELGFS